MTSDDLIARLAAHRTIGGAAREELEWIANHGAFRTFQAGEIIARESDTIDEMYILLAGRVAIWMNRAGGRRRFLEWGAGDVTGLLPYSRLKHPPGDTLAEEPVEAVALRREQLPELARNCHQVTTILVHAMTDRARQFTSGDLRDEKLVSLGKLAAGLAHELNNPASALMRDAKSMTGVLASSNECARRLISARLSDLQLAELDEARAAASEPRSDGSDSGLALADREEEFARWLAAHGAAEEIAPELAKTSLSLAALERLAAAFRGGELDTALRSIAAGHTVRALAAGLERAATRIHSLVTSVKRFTHMDRDTGRGPVDIAVGLADTVALLAGKARSRSVVITPDIPSTLPPAHGISAEINQIWMNLVDNAIDASMVGGKVAITASCESSSIIVRVTDDGPGIPEEIVGRIFDPFFTTKQVGEGTGLGLDIVRRIVDLHQGTIDVNSRPGRTEFRVSLPALV